jgi:hypothetical protein
LLVEGDQAFAQLPDTRAAAALVAHLWALLGPHLRLEEDRIIPLLRGARQFPPVASPEELELFAQGFAWASHGIAPEVLEKVYAMLPPELSGAAARGPGGVPAEARRHLGPERPDRDVAHLRARLAGGRTGPVDGFDLPGRVGL